MKRSRRLLLSQLIYSTLRTARVGGERDGVKVVALCERNVGGDGAKSFGRNHQRDRVEGHQRAGRIDEHEDPEDQVAGMRLP